MAAVNPLRYRSYYHDSETGFYYLQSRYYDPEICRFINADSYASTGQSYLGYNTFAYCGNDPVNRTDADGEFWDTVFDIVSLGFSIVEVAANPSDPMAWIGLAGDVVDLIPFVTGVGETVKAVAVVANTADTIADVHKAAKAVDQVDDVVDAAKAVYKAADKTSDIRKATGSYEILYESGKNYVGKGGFKRAIDSAIEHAKSSQLNNYLGDTVLSITWDSAPNRTAAFVAEFYKQCARGVGNASTYNKIWSPGKKIAALLF